MCGIGGIFLHAPTAPAVQDLVQMANVMRWRGPDDMGTFTAPHIGMVHLRLSVRDLSPAGRCPMPSATDGVQILLNGEIYNWRELREELRRTGYSFHSESDSEVIANGFEAWGTALIPRLRGMFAVAIWDPRTDTMILARDRVGEKPLYYRQTAEGLQFASSIEAISRVAGPDRTIDPDAVVCFMSHAFIPGNHTVWTDIAVLPPACMLEIRPGSEPVIERYWSFPQVAPTRRAERDVERDVHAALTDSVRRCLEADVPVGVFLSGGVDSSLVAAMASREHPAIPAFSLGFREDSHSELPYARRVARHIGVSLHEVIVEPNDVLEALPHLVLQYGQPFGDSSSVMTYLVSKLAREHVTVCLSGDGGDEAFGGYWRIQAGAYADRYARMIPAALRQHLIPRVAARLGGPGKRLMAMNRLSMEPAGGAYTNAQSWFQSLERIAGPRMREALGHDAASCRTGPALAWEGASAIQRVQFNDYAVQLPDAFLTKVDVASMAASLEVRAPFLDHTIIELAWSIPDNAKLRWGSRKHLLKRLAARMVPADVIYRKKMGFSPPIAAWMRRELGTALLGLMEQSRSAAEGWIDRDVVLATLADHRDGHDHSTRLWMTLWFELWFRIVVAREDPTSMQLGAMAPADPHGTS